MTREWFEEVSGKRLFIRKLLPEGASVGEETPVVVFLHEGLGSVNQWKDFPHKFIKKCSLPVLLYDRIGYGKSSPRSEKRELDYLHREEEVLNRLIHKLSLKSYILLGHSEGGSLALIHAARRPAGLRKVIVLSANTQEESCITTGIEKVRREYEKPDSKLKQALRKYHGKQCDAVFYAWCDTWTAPFFQSWNIISELQRIQVPVLAFHGRNDQYTSLRQVENLKEYLSGEKEIHVLDNGSHHPHFDYPEEVLDAVCRFVRS
jgi:pimeloyl-ACP methyl ester carboxylesterase